MRGSSDWRQDAVERILDNAVTAVTVGERCKSAGVDGDKSERFPWLQRARWSASAYASYDVLFLKRIASSVLIELEDG